MNLTPVATQGTFSSDAIVMHLGPVVTHCFLGNLISAKLIVQQWCLTDHSTVTLNRCGGSNNIFIIIVNTRARTVFKRTVLVVIRFSSFTQVA